MNQTEARTAFDMMYASEIASLAPSRWERWVAAAEKILGFDLDGDQEVNGYCLDVAYNKYTEGLTVAEYVEFVRDTIKGLGNTADTESPAGTQPTMATQ